MALVDEKSATRSNIRLADEKDRVDKFGFFLNLRTAKISLNN